jgi:large subunit ribosomal protein L9
MERFESERVQREADNLTRKSEAEGIAKKMENLSVSLIRAASEMGQLYGSVTSRDIAEGVTAQGYTVSKNQVDLNTAIKTLGLMPVNVILHPEVSVEVTVNIARSKDEAEEQIKLGRAIVNDVAERERLEAAEAAKAAEKRMAEFDAEDEQDTTGRDDSASNDAGANADADSTDDVADENADA